MWNKDNQNWWYKQLSKCTGSAWISYCPKTQRWEIWHHKSKSADIECITNGCASLDRFREESEAAAQELGYGV